MVVTPSLSFVMTGAKDWPSLTSTVCGLPSTTLPFSSRIWGVMVKVTPLLAAFRSAVTFGARLSFPASPWAPASPLAPSLISTICGVPSTTSPFSSRLCGVIVRVTPSFALLRTAVTFGARPSWPFTPAAPVSPLSPLAPFSPFFTTNEVVVPFGFLMVIVCPSGVSVVEISGDLPSAPSLPFSPCGPWAPLAPSLISPVATASLVVSALPVSGFTG